MSESISIARADAARGAGGQERDLEPTTLSQNRRGAVSSVFARLRARSAPAAPLIARGLGLFISLCLTAFFGRVLRPDVLGDYFLFLTWMNVLGTAIALGLPFVVLRSIGQRGTTAGRLVARAVVADAQRTIAFAGLITIVAVLLFGRGAIRVIYGDGHLWALLVVSAVAGVFTAGNRVNAEAIKAMGRPALGVVVENAIVPAIVIAALVPIALTKRSIGTYGVSGTYVAALAACVALCLVGIRRRVASPIRDGAWRTKPKTSLWAVDLVTIVSVYLPFLLLPRYATAAQIGHFGIAHRLVQLAIINQLALAAHFGPRFARDWALGNRHALRRTLWSSQGVALLAYVPFFLAYLVAGRQVLSVFGPQFADSTQLLAIMACGQMASAISGLSNYLLYMSGSERFDLAGQVVSIVVVLVIAAILGPTQHATGIAIAYAAGVVVRSATSLAFAWRQIRRPALQNAVVSAS